MKYFLVGFMGSGKSTIGKLLSERLNIKHFDLDDVIQNQENKSISEIFSIKGEDYFRILEKKHQKSNLAELYIGIIKEAIRKDMRDSNCPLRLWDYCAER